MAHHDNHLDEGDRPDPDGGDRLPLQRPQAERIQALASQLDDLIQLIDQRLGTGYAREHPEVLAACVQYLAVTDAAVQLREPLDGPLARSVREGAEKVRAELRNSRIGV